MDLIQRLTEGNRRYWETADKQLLKDLAVNGQHPFAIVICCSDSRVVPEQIFSVSVGDLFVIRVAGNVLDRHQLGSVEYAAAHLHCGLVVLLGHTRCGAVSAALEGRQDGFISFITDDILKAVGPQRDPLEAACQNVRQGVDRIRREFEGHPEVSSVEVRGAMYDLETGRVDWL